MIELTRMELENFCPFFGRHDIDIGHSKNKLVIFDGGNGGGKTSLLKAIQWCLFGFYTHKAPKDKIEADFNLLNKEALCQSNMNAPMICRVTLTFEKNDGETPRQKIVFSRVMHTKRKKPIYTTTTGALHPQVDGFEFVKTEEGGHQDFSALHWVGSAQKTVERKAKDFRETYFPSLVNDYYIIYGEEFVDPRNPEKLRTAISKNCFAETFDKVKGNLEQLKMEILREHTRDKKRREALDELIGKSKDIAEKLKEYRDRRSTCETNIGEIREGISKLDRQIGRSGGAQVELLKDERAVVEEENKNITAEIKELEKDIAGTGFDILIKMLSQDARKDLATEIQKHVKKGDIPPKIKTEFINSLIEGGRCICKRPLSAKEKKILKQLRDENILGENYQEFLDMRFKLLDLNSRLPQEIQDYKSRLSEVDEKRRKLSSNTTRLAQISDELNSLKNVSEYEQQRTKFAKRLVDIETDQALLTTEISELENRQRTIQKEVSRIGQSGVKYAKSYADLDELIDLMDKVKQNTIDSARNDMEKFASETYKNLFKHVSEIDRIEIDSNYQTRVVFRKGNKEYIKSDFSTGESLIFAISFLTALRTYSGYTGPMFLDSPFSVLDEEHRVRVSLNIPDAIPGQLIIFTRPDTFEDMKEKLMKRINKILTLTKEKEWNNKISE